MLKYPFGFQISGSPVFDGIINFHHDLFFFLIVICSFVFYMLGRCIILYNSESLKNPVIVVHAPILEIIWTLIPAIILIFVAIPSFSLLYSMDEIIDPFFTIKVIGHQWYWSYEFLDPSILFNEPYEGKVLSQNPKENLYMFDSYLLADDLLIEPSSRLLDVDNRLYLPIEANIHVLLTAADVLHSWAIPALGIKLDACPGRLNQTSLYINRPGLFFGQCSEICGVNHGFMPIAIVGIDILGDGSKLSKNIMDQVLPLYFELLFRS